MTERIADPDYWWVLRTRVELAGLQKFAGAWIDLRRNLIHDFANKDRNYTTILRFGSRYWIKRIFACVKDYSFANKPLVWEAMQDCDPYPSDTIFPDDQFTDEDGVTWFYADAYEPKEAGKYKVKFLYEEPKYRKKNKVSSRQVAYFSPGLWSRTIACFTTTPDNVVVRSSDIWTHIYTKEQLALLEFYELAKDEAYMSLPRLRALVKSNESIEVRPANLVSIYKEYLDGIDNITESHRSALTRMLVLCNDDFQLTIGEYIAARKLPNGFVFKPLGIKAAQHIVRELKARGLIAVTRKSNGESLIHILFEQERALQRMMIEFGRQNLSPLKFLPSLEYA